jgi:hypothetical protein
VYAIAAVLALCLFAVNGLLIMGGLHESVIAFHVVLALEPVYALGLLHLLDVRAGRALKRMRPLLTPAESFDALDGALRTMPARLVSIGSLGGLVIGVGAVLLERLALPAVFRQFISSGFGRAFVEAWLVLTWVLFGVLFVHTVHQLRLISRIYTHHTVIDLDNYQPLFHFSVVSALTAIGLLVIPYAWYLVVPNLIRDPVGVLFGAIFPFFALISFLWPLIGVHNLMVEAKGRELFENARALKAVRQELFSRANSGTLEDASELHDTLEAVRSDRDALLSVPTWPWQPGTPRSVAAALALPLAIWLLQWALQQLVGQ